MRLLSQQHLLNPDQLARVAAAIHQAEQHTDAELVTVLARRADSYYFIPALWAAMIALLTPVILGFTPFWLSAMDLLIAQWLVFVVLVLLFRVPAITMWMIPRRVARGRAALLARDQFIANNLHHTAGATGLLIFVSEAERYVEIVADRGISKHVADSEWQAIVDAFIQRIKAGHVSEGFVACIDSCGALLKQHVPLSHEKNELPNHLVVLD
jgi:putative membrane protein